MKGRRFYEGIWEMIPSLLIDENKSIFRRKSRKNWKFFAHFARKSAFFKSLSRLNIMVSTPVKNSGTRSNERWLIFGRFSNHRKDESGESHEAYVPFWIKMIIILRENMYMFFFLLKRVWPLLSSLKLPCILEKIRQHSWSYTLSKLMISLYYRVNQPPFH